MTDFIIGNLLTGRRIQTLNVSTGAWVDTLNAAGSITAKVSLRDPTNRALGLAEAAAVGKTFLAAVQDGVVLQAGPIWAHDYDLDDQSLTLSASGMWSYFDHRVLLPVLAGRLPTDTTTDTNLASSYQGMVCSLVAQAQTWTNGNVPVILPPAIAGTFVRNYTATDLAFVGARIAELTQIQGGPDVRFVPQFTSDMLGIQWTLLVGTPTQPLLYSPIDAVFAVSSPKTSVSGVTVHVDGTSLSSQAFASGGRASDSTLVTVSTDGTLTGAGYPLLEAVDSSHQTVVDVSTLQGYSDELVLRGKASVKTFTLTHDTTLAAPYLGGISPGDFAQLRFHGDPYLPDGARRMRATQVAGDEVGRKITIQFQPEVV